MSSFTPVNKNPTQPQYAQPSQQPAPTSQPVGEVETIVDSKEVKGATHYLVKWKGFDSAHNTWEPKSTLRIVHKPTEPQYQPSQQPATTSTSQPLATTLVPTIQVTTPSGNKQARDRPEFGLLRVLCTEGEIRRIRLNYNLAPLEIFQPNAKAGKLVKIATRDGEPVLELCKSVRVSNAEFGWFQQLRRSNGGHVPQIKERLTENEMIMYGQGGGKRLDCHQTEWEEANKKANARFEQVQAKKLRKALAARNGSA